MKINGNKSVYMQERGASSVVLTEQDFIACWQSKMLLATTRKFLNHKDEAEDLLSEVVLSVWAKRETIQIQCRLTTYLFSAIKQACWKRNKRVLDIAPLGDCRSYQSRKFPCPYTEVLKHELLTACVAGGFKDQDLPVWEHMIARGVPRISTNQDDHAQEIRVSRQRKKLRELCGRKGE